MTIVNKNENKGTKVVESVNETLAEPDKEEFKVDSLLLVKTVNLKKAIIEQLDNFTLVVRMQLDGDCSGTDSLYYDKKHNLKVEKSRFGCSAEENVTLSVYDNGIILYYKITSGGDGIITEINEIFYNQSKAYYGIKEKFDIDYEKRTIISTKISNISEDELENISEIKSEVDNRLGNVIERILNLKVNSTYKDNFVLIDTIQNIMEERKFLVDSTLYKKLEK